MLFSHNEIIELLQMQKDLIENRKFPELQTRLRSWRRQFILILIRIAWIIQFKCHYLVPPAPSQFRFFCYFSLCPSKVSSHQLCQGPSPRILDTPALHTDDFSFLPFSSPLLSFLLFSAPFLSSSLPDFLQIVSLFPSLSFLQALLKNKDFFEKRLQ